MSFIPSCQNSSSARSKSAQSAAACVVLAILWPKWRKIRLQRTASADGYSGRLQRRLQLTATTELERTAGVHRTATADGYSGRLQRTATADGYSAQLQRTATADGYSGRLQRLRNTAGPGRGVIQKRRGIKGGGSAATLKSRVWLSLRTRIIERLEAIDGQKTRMRIWL
jgi:Na+-translocating ferredoxin:NAD+ oxidoreductase RnfG subunit